MEEMKEEVNEKAATVKNATKKVLKKAKTKTKSALKIAEFLENHPKVKKVYYPGLTSHAGYEINKKQASCGGAVLSFELENCKAVKTLFKHIQYPIVAVSLGGVESILSYPVKMSHASVPEEERLKQGITSGLVRLSVGIEETCDLIEDLEQALEKIGEEVEE